MTFRQAVRTIKGYRSLLGKNRRGRWGEHMPEHISPKNSTPPRRTRLQSFLLDPCFSFASFSSPRRALFVESSVDEHAVPSTATRMNGESRRSRPLGHVAPRGNSTLSEEGTDGASYLQISHQRRGLVDWLAPAGWPTTVNCA